jgi:hypothetical protein
MIDHLYPFCELRGYLMDMKHKTILGQSSELLRDLLCLEHFPFSLFIFMQTVSFARKHRENNCLNRDL